MADRRIEIEQTDRRGMLFDDVYPMTQSEMRITSGGAKPGSVLADWLALCEKYPDSAPCKGRH